MWFFSPEYALPRHEKNAILRNINRQNISIQNNPGNYRPIAHFMTKRFVYPVLLGSNHFTGKKVMVWCVSMREKPFATKIFINSQIEKKYNPFR
jgi:hypothetical protein